MSQDKKAYFQGGGGVNEPTPKKKKYKSDEAIVNQPRFKEPLYRNYDLYETEGVNGPAKHGPGAGWNSMQDYKSVGDFLKARRKKLKDKYKADDSWIQDNGSLSKKPKDSKARMETLQSLVKTASEDDHFHIECINCGNRQNCKCMTNKTKLVSHCDMCDTKIATASAHDHFTCTGCGHRCRCRESAKNVVAHCNFCDLNLKSLAIDFAIDDQINSTPILGDSGTFSDSVPIGGLTDEYTQDPDAEGKLPTELNYGRDYDKPTDPKDLKKLFPNKEEFHNYIQSLLEEYLNWGEEPFYGLPDGLEEREDGSDRMERPYGKTDSESTIYDKTWF